MTKPRGTWAAEVDRMLSSLSEKEREVLAWRFGIKGGGTNEELLEAARAKMQADPFWAGVHKARVAREESRRTMARDGLTPEERLLRAIFGEGDDK